MTLTAIATDNRDVCKHCGSLTLTTVKTRTQDKQNFPHYAKLVCADCGKFHRWLKDPKVTAEYEERVKDIDTLLSNGFNLGLWEENFLLNIKPLRTLTDNQKSKLADIKDRCGCVS